MFGTFGQAFFDAYEAFLPLESGFHELRSALYRLYPALVHVRLFGSAFLPPIEQTLKLLDCSQKRTGPEIPGRSSLRNEPNSKGNAY